MAETKEQCVENARSQMRKGVLEFCILLIVSCKAVYATEILQELMKAELLVVEGTLYPLLSRLREDGLLSYEWEESKAGPPRKYYGLTAKGKSALAQYKEAWSILNESVEKLIKRYE